MNLREYMRELESAYTEYRSAIEDAAAHLAKRMQNATTEFTGDDSAEGPIRRDRDVELKR